MPLFASPQHRWDLLLTNLAGTVVGQIFDPVDLKYTRVESGACGIEFNTLDPTDLNLVQVLPHKRKVKVYRDNELVFWGKIREPLVITQDGAQVKAVDPWGSLNAPAHVQMDFTDDTLLEILTTIKSVEGLVGYHPMNGIALAGTPAETFTATLKMGQRISEFVESLCSSNPNSGSWFRVDAQDDPAEPAVLTCYDYTDRVDNAQARWEYGNATLDNVTSFQIEHRGLCNSVRVYYKGGWEEVQDLSSIDEYGLAEKWLRRPGVSDAATAVKIANSKIKATPYTIGSFEPAANAPALFDDFDVGDKCRTYFQMGAAKRISGEVMYYQADDMIPSRVELTVDKSGVENMAFGDGAVSANRRDRKNTLRRHPNVNMRFK